MSFGANLARLRRSRSWSQEELSVRAGLSQRHVSFLETGRAKPGDRSLSKLTKALGLKGWEHRALLASLAPLCEVSSSRSYDRAFIQEVIERVTRWPAYAFQPDGTLLATNLALDRLFEHVAPGESLWDLTAPQAGPNIYDLVFHPKGLVRWMENPEETLPETLRRLRISASQDQTLIPTLNRVEAYATGGSGNATDMVPPPILVERYRIGGRTLSVISVLSHFASPGELELDVLQIESFVPADQQSEALLAERWQIATE